MAMEYIIYSDRLIFKDCFWIVHHYIDLFDVGTVEFGRATG